MVLLCKPGTDWTRPSIATARPLFDPDYAWAHYNLATALRPKGRLEESYEHYQHVIRVDPKNPEVHNGLASVLLREGRGQEAQADWRKALEANPPEHLAWLGYAELCLFLEQPAEYRRIQRALLDRFGTTGDPYIAEPIGRTCLLAAGPEDEIRKAAAFTDRALAAKASTPEWIYRYFLFAKGLAEYRQGRLDTAISLMEGQASAVMGPCPRLVMAMAQQRQGQKKLARKTLALAVVAFDWSAAQADNRDVWMCHILRREAEAAILPDLPAFLAGEYHPRDNDEQLALVGICQFRGLNRAAASLYADAIAADSDVAESLTRECQSRAARSGTTDRPSRGVEHRMPLPRRSVRGPGRLRTGRRWGQARRGRAPRGGECRLASGYRPTWLYGPRRWTVNPRRPASSPGRCWQDGRPTPI